MAGMPALTDTASRSKHASSNATRMHKQHEAISPTEESQSTYTSEDEDEESAEESAQAEESSDNSVSSGTDEEDSDSKNTDEEEDDDGDGDDDDGSNNGQTNGVSNDAASSTDEEEEKSTTPALKKGQQSLLRAHRSIVDDDDDDNDEEEEGDDDEGSDQADHDELASEGTDEEKIDEDAAEIPEDDSSSDDFVESESESALEEEEEADGEMEAVDEAEVAGIAALGSEESEASDAAYKRGTARRRRRLRQGLRGSYDNSGEDDSENDSATIAERISRRQLARNSSLLNGADSPDDRHGYVSSPTASVSRRLRRGHANDSLPSSSLRLQLDEPGPDATNSTASSGPMLNIDTQRKVSSSRSQHLNPPKTARRKVAPSLISNLPEPETESAATSPPPPTPPAIIDKPREERSYKEFFPDLNLCAPLAVQRTGPQPLKEEPRAEGELDTEDLDKRLLNSNPADGGESSALSSVLLTPLSSQPTTSALSEVSTNEEGEDGSDGGEEPRGEQASALGAEDPNGSEKPSQSRASSSLSIKLVFNDPQAYSRPQLTLEPPPPLPFAPTPGPGKAAGSFSGTPQSSVVVLAPKKPVLTLPETRFKRLGDKDAHMPYKPAEFKRPESHYIRHVELTEKDLAERVEYDLEDMDHDWLVQLNKERSEQGMSEISANLLETIVDHIEKEWFDLVKDVQKAISAIHQEQLPAEDAACAICGEEECDNTNAIVFCDGCNLAVHQDCYGVPYIPEGQWLCRKCMLSPDKAVSCILCPQRGGAFKKTTTNKWAHLLCALWIPEVGISNTVYMEPIDSVDQIPRSRWKLYCHLCHRKVGACIQCSHRQCFTAFHATCARKAHLAMSVKPDKRTGEPVFRAYCERHTPASHSQKVDLAAPLKSLGTRRRNYTGPASLSLMSMDLTSLLSGSINGSKPVASGTPAAAAPAGAVLTATPGSATPLAVNSAHGSSAWPPAAPSILTEATADTTDLFKKANAAAEEVAAGGDPLASGCLKSSEDASLKLTMKVFNPDRPVLNEFVYNRVLDSIPANRIGVAQRAKLMTQIARYWALKRSVRHGAPLLKRLHLEPWTASATQQRALEMEEEQRQMFIRRIRTDLERVRLLVESVRRREREKLKRARLQVEYLQRIVDPLTPVLMPVIDELLEKRDPRGALSHPVSAEEAPDYHLFIKEPMDFGTIKRKLEEFRYRSIEVFEYDLNLVVRNCMAYNKPTTYYYQLATRVKRHIDRLMAKARAEARKMPVDPETGRLLIDVDFDIFSLNTADPRPLPSDYAQSSDEDIENDIAEAGEAKQEAGKPTSEVTSPMTRSRSKQVAENDVSADLPVPAALVPAPNKAPGQNLEGSSSSHSTDHAEPVSVSCEQADEQPEASPAPDAETRVGPEPASGDEKPADTAADNTDVAEEARAKEEQEERQEDEPMEQPPPKPRKKAKGWAWITEVVEEPTDSLGAEDLSPSLNDAGAVARPRRRMTLFEQLSVPPPDVRMSQRARYAHYHGSDAKSGNQQGSPDSDIPDNINVLKERLRKTAGDTNPQAAGDAPSSAVKRRRSESGSSGSPADAEQSASKRQRSEQSPTRKRPGGSADRKGTLHTAASLGEDPSTYPVGTAVWAKMPSYPWFPAETYDPDDANIPREVHSDRRDDSHSTLVYFFSSNSASRSWKWVTAQQVCRLGADKKIDAQMYKARKARSTNMVKSIRTAYLEACRSKDIEPLAP